MITKKLYIYFYILSLLIVFSNNLIATLINTPDDLDPALEGRASHASRSAVIYFQNRTAFPLTRTDYNLDGGEWTQTPPHTIPARKQIAWASESSGFATGTQGSASYLCEDTTTKVDISWNVPYSGANSATSPVYNSVGGTASRRFVAGFGSGWEHDNNIVVHNIFMPTDSFFAMDAKALEEQVYENSLSSVIYLENSSPVTMNLINHSLNNGNWIQKPVPDILPGEWAVWGCGGNNSSGVQLDGSVNYHVLDHNSTDGEQITNAEIRWIAPWRVDFPGTRFSTTIGNSQTPSTKFKFEETIDDRGDHSIVHYKFKKI